METVNSQPNRVLAAVGVLVVTGWAWSLSNVAIPDVLWFATMLLTLVFIGLLAVAGVQRIRRA
jgi:hypothetical protein